MSKQPRQIKANKKADITRQDELSASETTNSQPIGNESMNSLTVLNHEIHQVESLYSLNDLHKASGGQDKHRPAFFVRNQEVKELANEIMQCANLHSDQVIRKVNGGHNRGTYACKEIVYRYAMWISPKFALAVIRVFDAYVTGKLEPKAKPKTTVADRVPLKDAVNILVAKSSLNYSDAYKMVHQFMGVDSIDQIPLEDLPRAVAYVHSLMLVAGRASHPLDAYALTNLKALVTHNFLMVSFYKTIEQPIKALNPSLWSHTFEHFWSAKSLAIGFNNQFDLGVDERYLLPYRC